MQRASSSLRQRVAAQTADTLLESAERTMIRLGYDKATMQEIAADAGCAPGTFYLYFKNKQDILDAIVIRHSITMHHAGCRSLRKETDPRAQFRGALETMLGYVWKHRPFFRLFFAAVPFRAQAMRSHYGKSVQPAEEYRSLELDMLRRGQALGQFRRDIPAEQLQQYAQAVSFSMVEEFVFSGHTSLEELVDLLWGLISRGFDVGSPDETH